MNPQCGQHVLAKPLDTHGAACTNPAPFTTRDIPSSFLSCIADDLTSPATAAQPVRRNHAGNGRQHHISLSAARTEQYLSQAQPRTRTKLARHVMIKTRYASCVVQCLRTHENTHKADHMCSLEDMRPGGSRCNKPEESLNGIGIDRANNYVHHREGTQQ